MSGLFFLKAPSRRGCQDRDGASCPDAEGAVPQPSFPHPSQRRALNIDTSIDSCRLDTRLWNQKILQGALYVGHSTQKPNPRIEYWRGAREFLVASSRLMPTLAPLRRGFS